MKPESETNADAQDALSAKHDLGDAHASDRLPFRPDATPAELVDEFAGGENRIAACLALYARGPDALPAVREGLKHPDSEVRRWSAICADMSADVETLHALKPLLNDPKPEVRLWAVHSLSCESCRDGPNPIDATGLLLERIEQDANIRVRRKAVVMLAHHRTPDARVLPIFKKIMSRERDRNLRLYARQGLERYAAAGFSE